MRSPPTNIERIIMPPSGPHRRGRGKPWSNDGLQERMGIWGGSYPERDLADLSLSWIQCRSVEAGVAIDNGPVLHTGNPLGPVHDSFTECFGTFRRWFHARFYRPVMQTGTNTEVLDESVRIRLLQDPTYRPQNEGLRNALSL